MFRKKTIAFVASAFVTVISGVILSRMRRAVDPWRLLSFGLIALVFLNILVFIHNLHRAFASARRKSEREFEGTMEPALRGQLTQLTGDSMKFVGLEALPGRMILRVLTGLED